MWLTNCLVVCVVFWQTIMNGRLRGTLARWFFCDYVTDCTANKMAKSVVVQMASWLALRQACCEVD